MLYKHIYEHTTMNHFNQNILTILIICRPYISLLYIIIYLKLSIHKISGLFILQAPFLLNC